MIKFLGIPVIMDIDDNFKLGNDHPMSITANKEKWHEPIVNHLRKADYVTTTTPIFAKKHNKNVKVFPNAINPEEKQYALEKTPRTDRLRVGIICGSSHLKDLELLGDIARQVDQDKVQFVLCGLIQEVQEQSIRKTEALKLDQYYQRKAYGVTMKGYLLTIILQYHKPIRTS